MPVQRFRRIEDVPEPSPAASPLEGLASACRLSELTAGIGRTAVAPRGVLRFRSVEEMDAQRRRREDEAAKEGA